MNGSKTTTKAGKGNWRSTVMLLCVPLALWAALWIASVVSDGSRVPSELADSALESTVMVCSDGSIVHDGDSMFERLTGSGYFRCTDWHMRGAQTAPSRRPLNWPTSPKR